MPILKVIQLGKPSVEGMVEECSTYAEAFAALGLSEPKTGQLLVNGASPVEPTDRIRANTTVHFNAAVKGAH
jgi:hypothetical protein